MTIFESTSQYESWLGGLTNLDQDDLKYKHEQMANREDAFPFFRGTYYRWAQHWTSLCSSLAEGPKVLAIGDLHIENYGTWRDFDGRLCWGVNDFDEADDLAYSQDLVRLATSLRFVKQSTNRDMKFKSACSAILDGYRTALEAGGDPFVLEERHPQLRALVLTIDREPDRYWKKLLKQLNGDAVPVPYDAMMALKKGFPLENINPEFRRRSRVGMGSLGKPRFVAIVDWAGGWLAREVKFMSPPSTAWIGQRRTPSRITEIVTNSKRSPDPFYLPGSTWITRRLGPHCSRIEIEQLATIDEVDQLLHAMGADTANVHLGTTYAKNSIIADLSRRPPGWLVEAAKTMADAIHTDWSEWCASH